MRRPKTATPLKIINFYKVENIFMRFFLFPQYQSKAPSHKRPSQRLQGFDYYLSLSFLHANLFVSYLFGYFWYFYKTE